MKPIENFEGLPEPEPCLGVKLQQLLDEGYSRQAAECLANNWEYVRTKYTGNKLKTSYNIRLTQEDVNIDMLKEFLMQIHNLQPNAYRINIGWGCLLQHIENEQWKHFYPQLQSGWYWKTPTTIRTREDLLNAIEHLDTQDINDHLTLLRQETAYVLKRIVSFHINIFPLPDHSLLGEVAILPQHIIKHQYVKTLSKDSTKTPYKDKMCCFRCISYHLYGEKQIQTNAKRLAEEFRKYSGNSEKKFTGKITLDQLFQVELCFDLKISVYSLFPKEPNETDDAGNASTVITEKQDLNNFEARLVRGSGRKLNEAKNGELFLDLSNNHLSYITSIQNYANSYSCATFQKLFKKRWECTRHQRRCFRDDNKQRAMYKHGAFKMTESIFYELEQIGIKLNSDDRFCEYYTSFDFETVNVILDDSDPRKRFGEKLTFSTVLELCSCSVNSSVPGFNKPYFIRRINTESEFMSRVVDYLCVIAEKSEQLQQLKYSHIFEQLDEKINLSEQLLKNCLDEDIKGHHKKLHEKQKNLRLRLEKQIRAHVIYAFNGSRFDLKVARQFLLEEFFKRQMKITAVIKKQSAYVLLATSTLVFKDMACLLGPGTSLDKFFQSFDLPVSKWAFPYDYITDLSKLDEKELPPYSAFWSSLKGRYLVDEDGYKEISEWYRRNAKCLWDYLEEYNNRDVDSMIPGIEQLRIFWKQYDICMVRTEISLSSLSARLMHKSVPIDSPFIWLPGKQESYVHDLAKESVVGGPALIWTRYSEKDKTYIRQGEHVCKSVLGLDANALYLDCLSKEMPTSYAVEWRVDKNGQYFNRKPLIPAWVSVGEIEYCCWLQYITKDPNLRHAYNYGQAQFGDKKFRPDAYSVRDNFIYHYFGCYWHFCANCKVGEKRLFDNPSLAAYRTEEDKKMMQYFEKLGINQKVMFECQWKEAKKSNPEVRTFLDRKLDMPLSNVNKLTKNGILEKIRTGELFGFARVSLKVPKENYEKFKEFCPIFKTRVVTRDDLSEFQLKLAEENNLLKHGRKTLISVMQAEKIVLITPLIQWYMNNGLVIEDIFEVVQFKPAQIFNDFAKNVTHHRMLADSDESKKQLGIMHKTAGNGAYGKTLENRANFVKTRFTDENTTSKLVNRKDFIDLEAINDELYEVTLSKKRYLDTVPRTIGAFVLGYAKLKLLQMYYEFLDNFFDRSLWELNYADTDSFYMSLSVESLEEFEKLVPIGRLDEYQKSREKFLVTDKSKLRQPGLFKVEYSGTGIVCLSPKVYCAWNDEKDTTKMSCKGINQRQMLEKDKYLEVLNSQRDMELENVGFRFQHGRMYQYSQKKKGLLYFFIKRKLNADGITTEPHIE